MWQTPSICLGPAWLSVFNYFSEAIWAQIRIMSAQHPPSSELEVAAIPIGLRIVAMFLRTLFLGALVAITVRISSPQSETIWTVYETFGDLRCVCGLCCIFLGFPKTQGHIGGGFTSALWSPRSHWRLPSPSGDEARH